MIECSISELLISAVAVDGSIRPDVAIVDDRPLADDDRPADGAVGDLGAVFDDDAAVDLGILDRAADVRVERIQDQPVGLEHVLELAGVLPPALDDMRLDALALVDQALDGVGDLQLAARARA